MTTVPSSVAVWNSAVCSPSGGSQIDTTSVSPGSTGRLNRADMDRNRAGSPAHSVCSSARPVNP